MNYKILTIEKSFEDNDEFFKRTYTETRYIIVDEKTGEILDDAQGYGYKTQKSAHKAAWYKWGGGKKKVKAKDKAQKKLSEEEKENIIDAEVQRLKFSTGNKS